MVIDRPAGIAEENGSANNKLIPEDLDRAAWFLRRVLLVTGSVVDYNPALFHFVDELCDCAMIGVFLVEVKVVLVFKY